MGLHQGERPQNPTLLTIMYTEMLIMSSQYLLSHKPARVQKKILFLHFYQFLYFTF